MLFPILKTIRRSFEPHRVIEWYVAGDIAMALYAYSSGLPALSLLSPYLDIRVVLNSIEDASHLESVLESLVTQGFSREGDGLDFHYPLSTVHIHFSTVKKQEGQIVWMKNQKGKYTYPLLEAEVVMDQKLKALNSLPLLEKNRELEQYSWMKDVMNEVIIE
jgi:hypothetical protein